MDLYGDHNFYAAERTEEVQILNPLKLVSLGTDQIQRVREVLPNFIQHVTIQNGSNLLGHIVSKAGNPVSGQILGIRSDFHPGTDRLSG